MNLITTKNTTLNGWSDWGAIIRPRRYNWTDFHFIVLTCEHSRNLGNLYFEFHIAFMGLNLYWDGNWSKCPGPDLAIAIAAMKEHKATPPEIQP